MSAKNKTEQRLSFLKLSPYQTKKKKAKQNKKGSSREGHQERRAKHLFNVFGWILERKGPLSGVEFSFMAQDKIHDYCSFCQNYNIKWNVLKPDEEWGGQRGLVS